MSNAENYYLNITNSETVDLILKRSKAEVNVIGVEGALKGALGRPSQSFGESRVTTNMQTWTIPAATLTSSNELKPNDIIIDSDDVRWTIKEVRCICFRSRWVCETVKER